MSRRFHATWFRAAATTTTTTTTTDAIATTATTSTTIATVCYGLFLFFAEIKKVRRLKISFIFFRFSSLLRGVGGGVKTRSFSRPLDIYLQTVFIFRGGVFIVRANRSRSIVEHDDSDWFFRARITIDRGVEVELGSVGRGDGNHRGSI